MLVVCPFTGSDTFPILLQNIHLPDFLPTGICVGSANGASVRGLAGREEVKPVHFIPSILVWVACSFVSLVV